MHAVILRRGGAVWVKLPLIMGKSIAGTVSTLGANAAGVAVGERASHGCRTD
jgi:D-arabinose 1-dehydrogenase-like Zn-dependent alcohol dehydrogenase